MHVYPFIGMPDSGIPFAKPRFAIQREISEPLNLPQ